MATFYKFVRPCDCDDCEGKAVIATFAYVPENQRLNYAYTGDVNPGNDLYVCGHGRISTATAEIKEIKVTEEESRGLAILQQLYDNCSTHQNNPLAYAIDDRITNMAKKYLPPLGYPVADRNTKNEDFPDSSDDESDNDSPAA